MNEFSAPRPTGNLGRVSRDDVEIGVHYPHCRYDLRGQLESRCPECGHEFDPAVLRETAQLEDQPAHFSDVTTRVAWGLAAGAAISFVLAAVCFLLFDADFWVIGPAAIVGAAFYFIRCARVIWGISARRLSTGPRRILTIYTCVLAAALPLLLWAVVYFSRGCAVAAG